MQSFRDCLSIIYNNMRFSHYFQAQRVCTKVGQMWRAATLAGWQLYHDPNVDELGPGGSVQSVEGNQYRDIWKAACWKASENVGLLVSRSKCLSFSKLLQRSRCLFLRI